MKKIFILFSILVLAAASGHAQYRHGRGGRGYGGYHSYGGYHHYYGRPYVRLGIGLGLGAFFNPYPYYGYAYPPAYGYYGYPYAYPPGYAPPPPQYQYSYPQQPPAADSSYRAPQQNNPDPGSSDTQGPKPTRTWVASHWEHTAEGWVWVEGYWK